MACTCAGKGPEIGNGVHSRLSGAHRSTGGLPTIWELVAEAAGKLPEPFSRAALINWISARRPDVGIASIATHIQFATANSGSPATPVRRAHPVLRRVDRGLYERYRVSAAETPVGEAPVRVVLVASSGAHGPAPVPVATLFRSPGFANARAQAEQLRLPWFVLSAKHGLLDPGDVVSPYDVQIDERSASYRAAWGEWVVAQLSERVPARGGHRRGARRRRLRPAAAPAAVPPWRIPRSAAPGLVARAGARRCAELRRPPRGPGCAGEGRAPAPPDARLRPPQRRRRRAQLAVGSRHGVLTRGRSGRPSTVGRSGTSQGVAG